MAGLMCVMLSNADGSGSQDVIDHYRIQARGGAGMVIVAIQKGGGVVSSWRSSNATDNLEYETLALFKCLPSKE